MAWSRTTRLFQRLSGLLDPRLGRGLYPTFHARHPLVRWPLDHVFFSEHFLLAGIARLRYVGSDHFPILLRLCRAPHAPAVQDAPEADADDRREADQAVEAMDRAGPG